MTRAPKWLTNPESRDQWKKLAPEFFELEEATTALREQFARYCDTVAKWHTVREFIDKNGYVFPVYEAMSKDAGPNFKRVVKGMVPFPQVSIYRQLSETLGKMERELGITPE